jgi:hypothetical protein
MDGDIKFRATVVSHAFSIANTGTRSIKIWFQTKFYEDNQSEEARNKLCADLFLSDACFDKSMHVLTKTLGFTGSKLSELNNNNTLLAGRDCTLVCAYEEYEGVSRLKIKFINNIQKKIDSSLAEKFDIDFEGKLADYKKRSAAKASGKQEPPPLPGEAPLPWEPGFPGETNPNECKFPLAGDDMPFDMPT